jgi:hypothetical protein
MTDRSPPRPLAAGLPPDAGSLPFALFISLLGATLSALLMPVILLQIGASRTEARRVESLQAAQTGMNVAAAQIRTAYTGTDAAGNPIGDVSKLPCNSLTGDLGGGSTAHYRATIDYFAFDPSPDDYIDATGHYDDTWISANHLACHTGVPTNALIRAQGVSAQQPLGGTCSEDARCLRGTYAFTTTNETISGGLIHVYKTPASTDLCLSAGSDTLTGAQLTGTALIISDCNPTKRAQVFSYNNDLTIALAGSRSSDLPNGLCLDSRATAGLAVQFQPCAAADQATQQWIFTTGLAFVAADGTCLRVLSPNQSGSTVVHDNAQCGSGAYSNVADFTPEAAVGAGAAGSSSGQVVNQGQFGRCLEVTRADYLWHTGSGTPSLNDGPYLVSTGCKQTTPVNWNQVWAMPGVVASGASGVTGAISTVAPASNPAQGSPAGTYCLQSPASTAALQFAKVVPCTLGSTLPAHTTWTVTGYTGTDATSYIIRDDSTPGYCLTPQSPAALAADPYPFTDGNDISKIVVQPCDGSARQKWNAPANTEPRVAIGHIGEK